MGRSQPPTGRVNRNQAVSLLLTLIGIVLLWNTPVVYPLKILVVFFHELSHVLAAILTGGGAVSIDLTSDEGGLASTVGGSRFVILSAGYLGSLLIGGLLLNVAAYTSYDKRISKLLGMLIVIVGLLYIDRLSFGFAFAMITGAALIAAGVWLDAVINDFILKVIGLTSCLYAVLDIKSDLLDRSVPSDASQLADHVGLLPAWLWGALWFVIAIVGAGYFFLMALRAPQRPDPKARKHETAGA
jgi:hypothetical protein